MTNTPATPPETQVAATQQTNLGINTEKGGALLPPNSNSANQWQDIVDQISGFLSELPELMTKFFSDYQRPLVTLGLVVTALITVKITLAVLDAVNDVPLLAPIFELVGIGYSGWFIYRYLLRASTRKELVTEINNIKSQFMGQESNR